MTDCGIENYYFASSDFMILACHCLTAIQVPVFVFGSYCIIFKTPNHMLTVKWLLFNTHIWSSLSDFVICFMTVPYLFLPALAGYDLGLINNPGLSIYLLVTVTAFSGVSVLSIYENRYFILFCKKSWWRKTRKIYFCIIYGLVPLMFVAPLFDIPDQEVARYEVLKSIPCLPELTLENRKMFVLTLDFTIPFSCIFCAMLIVVASFLVFIFLTFSNIWFGDAWAASRQTMVLQRAFTKGVTVQTLYEFFILFIPVVTCLGTIFFWYHNQVINNIALLVVSLNGIGSTIIMLFAHKPYRTYTLSIFCFLCPKVTKKRESVHLRAHQLSALS
ncbi:Serpentine Receptor, class H [Caenorhabditis elegans]|uniref:Serpentine Receptor, class H n=1 Tax=Caenorhabditis elegans TaxID=6239 RepID=Q9BKN9_CAEEL|nr:Serpentine Receptor, class H [Caenorhabditis elegans]CCD66325.1 Serpentine Receptor, class H [Caenorhabditis elegans]|eukprot:NP_503777.3 Serpentine Receptor, class H [Caenorhabditis elegans]